MPALHHASATPSWHGKGMTSLRASCIGTIDLQVAFPLHQPPHTITSPPVSFSTYTSIFVIQFHPKSAKNPMRALDTGTCQFIEIDPEDISTHMGWKRHMYAILSHTWGRQGEQTYQELKKIQHRYAFKVEDTPHGIPPHKMDSSITFGRLTQSEVEALFSTFVEKYGLPRPSQSCPRVVGASSQEQDPRLNGQSVASLPSEQSPSYHPSTTTAPLISRSTRSNLSCFTRAMARMKSWIQFRSIRPSLNSTLSVTTLHRTPLERRPSPEHDEGEPSHAVQPSQLQNDSYSRSAHPPAAIGRLTQAEIDALFQAFAEKHYPQVNTNVTPAPMASNPSVVYQEHQSPPSPRFNQPPSATPHPPTARERLIKSKVKALFHDFAQAYSLTIPTDQYQSKSKSEMPRTSIWDDPELSPKIRDACAVARKNGYHYLWIDSCCIDKSSSSELSEAINSMYKWYGLADVCYAYLADVPTGEDHLAEDSTFRKSRWFERGWALQDLIAPLSVEFLSQDWAHIGSKHTLVGLVESVTKIDSDALLHLEPLDAFSVAQRLSWAANRKTTRTEDRAYSLFGIFDIKMPTLYGEGEGAFRRLQELILQRIPDQSLFAWGRLYPSSQLSRYHHLIDNTTTLDLEVMQWDIEWQSNLFAKSPDRFEYGAGIRTHQLPYMMEYTFTPHGIRTQFPMIPLTQDLFLRAMRHTVDAQLKFPDQQDTSKWYIAILGCEHEEHPGHLLGRVCCISLFESSVNFIYPAYINVRSQIEEYKADLLPLSLKTIEMLHPYIELKTVHIPHSNHASQPQGRNLQHQPYTTIKLVLSDAIRDSLRSRGYSADLRAPDRDHPTTHCLTLSEDEHTITVEFQHTLQYDGQSFTVDAEVRMSGSRVQFDSGPDSDLADRHTVSWQDRIRWDTKLPHKRVRLSAAGAGTLTVDLGLDFGGRGVYFLRVDVLGDAPLASSAIEQVLDQEENGE